MWAIAQTKPKQEYKAERNLINQGFMCYLPTIIRKRYRNDAWVSHKEVFFSNYIFINLSNSLHNLSKINSTYGISRLLINKDKLVPYSINEEYIETIKAKLSHKKHNNINNLKKGSNIIVTKGRLSNLTAIFIEKCSAARSKILINLLNKECVVKVDNTSFQQSY